ncbi:MAG TPA: hypothetical protein VLD62_10105, partial [Acidimicrobiia bacterium]|nr:hypothetical protein [Acidimicrobiia bacterium]
MTTGGGIVSRFKELGPGFWVKVAGLSLLDAVVLAVVPSLLEQGATVALVSMLIGTAGVNYIFISPRTSAFRWLVPGLVFLLLLMIWPIIFTVYVALTNWSTGNFITQEQAVERITEGTRFLITGDEAPIVDMYLYRNDAETAADDPTAGIRMLVVTEGGEQIYGTPRLRTDPEPTESPLIDLGAATITDEDGDGIPETIDGAAKLRLLDLGQIGQVLDQLVLDIPGRGRA